MDKKILLKKISHNFISQVTGKIISTLLGLISISLMTRYLGKQGFGQYTTIMAFLQFFGILVDFGLSLTGTQMISEPRANVNKIMSNIFSLRIISAVIFLGMAPLVVLVFPYDPIIKLGIALTSFSFFFIALYQVFTGIFQKNLVTHRAAIAEALNRILLLILIVMVIHWNKGLLGILLAIVLSNFLHFVLYYIFSLKYVKIKWEIDLKIWKKIFYNTWPIAITIIFNLIYFKADTLILSLFKSQEEVGIYGAPYKVLEVLTTLPYLFSGLILPLLTKYWADKNIKEFQFIFQRGVQTLSLFAVPMVLGTFIIAKPLMLVVAGHEFTQSGSVLKILIIATAIIFIGNLFSHAIVAINQQKKIIPYYILTAVFSVIGYLIFIPKYSIYGAAWMTVFSESLICISVIYVNYKTTGFFPSLKSWPAMILSGLLMYESLILWNDYIPLNNIPINLSIQIFLGVGIYFFTLIFLKTLSFNSLKNLVKFN